MTVDEIDESLINTKAPIFKYGDTVCSKSTGFPGVGKIISLINGHTYNAMCLNGQLTTWDIKFPEWKNEFIYIVAFENKRKPLRYDEFIDSAKENSQINMYRKEIIDKIYQDIPERRVIAYPEQDLELFE